MGHRGQKKSYQNYRFTFGKRRQIHLCPYPLYAFGYICGYISYDEYLIHSAPIVCYLQEEYNSWTQMYESYYYGDLLFLGRNKYSNVGARYGGYSDYEKMGENAERVIRY